METVLSHQVRIDFKMQVVSCVLTYTQLQSCYCSHEPNSPITRTKEEDLVFHCRILVCAALTLFTLLGFVFFFKLSVFL